MAAQINVIDSIFAYYLTLFRMTKEVLNISFVLFTFFDSLVSGICPEFFLLSNVQNLSTFIYPEFIQNFGIQNLSSFICSVYV
jgi:hypothetical protein